MWRKPEALSRSDYDETVHQCGTSLTWYQKVPFSVTKRDQVGNCRPGDRPLSSSSVSPPRHIDASARQRSRTIRRPRGRTLEVCQRHVSAQDRIRIRSAQHRARGARRNRPDGKARDRDRRLLGARAGSWSQFEGGSATMSVMKRWGEADDQGLLDASRTDAAAFGVFYARHERRLLAYLVRRTGSSELAADLCAEAFAVVLDVCRRRGPLPDVPVAWLFGVANHKLADSARSSQVDDRARRRLEMRAVELTRGQLSEIELLADLDQASCLLAGLSPDQREAVLAHVLEDRDYSEIARELRCSESVVRKRVSRGLAALRVRVQEGK